MLVGLDGIVRARAALGDELIGQSVADAKLLASYAQNRAGSFQNTSPIDGVNRIYSYREVKGFPLLVAVGLADDEVLAAYQASRTSYLEMGAVLSVLLIAISALIAFHQRGLQKTRELLRAGEAEFAQKSKLLELTLENINQGILMVDADRNVQVCNRRAIELLGLPEDLPARHPGFEEVLRWQWKAGEFGQDGRSVDEWLRGFVLAGGISETQQSYERRRPDGTVLAVRSIPLADGGMVRTYTDITARKQTEEELRAARDASDRAAKAKADFLAMMSYEIRSPMSGVLGVIELVRETPLRPDQAQMIEMVHASASSLLGVLNDVLDFSKIEVGAIAVTATPTAIRPLVGSVIEPMALTAAAKGLVLGHRVAPDVPEAVMVDELRLRQIIVNLLSNAVKFTASGAVDLSVDRVTSDRDAPRLRVSVRDTGIGMDAAVMARLFEPFTQADASTTRNFGGTGLGLSISRRLAHLLGGTLSVTSEPGKGSTFTLELPLVAAERPATSTESAIAVSAPREFEGERVLIVEDNSTNRWLARRQLERLGLSVDAAEDGFAGLELASANAYDLVITDCHMPGMDGTALASRIREIEAERSLELVPIIGLTADITVEMRERCLAAGMNTVELKPINLKRLEAALRRLFGLELGTAATIPAAVSPAEKPVFHLGSYRELFEIGNSEGADWLRSYLDFGAATVANIRRALAESDRGLLSASIHRLAGSSLCVGAIRLGEFCQRVEVAVPKAGVQELAAMVDQAGVEFDAARGEIARFISVKVEAVA